jgi:hypothetical protein
MNVKSCLKVDICLLYRTVSLKLEEVRLYTSTGACGAARLLRVVARRVLRVHIDNVVP